MKLTVTIEGSKLELVRMASKNVMIEVKKYLKLPRLSKIMKWYDVSNISAKLAVGAKNLFLDSSPIKNDINYLNSKLLDLMIIK